MRHLSLLAALLLPTIALAGPVKLAWDPNPPEEGVAKYAVMEGDVRLWEGAETEATVDLEPGVHVLHAVAIGRGINPDASEIELVSAPSETVRAEMKSPVQNFRVVAEITVTVRVPQ